MPYIMLFDADYGGGGPVLHIGGSSSTTTTTGGGPLGKGDDGGDQTSAAKSQARRAQVRKAQIQHRQRKANYTKQLEADVARLRDEIARTEEQGAALRGQNDAIRKRLAEAGVVAPLKLKSKQSPPAYPMPTTTTTTTAVPIATQTFPPSMIGDITSSQPPVSTWASSSASSPDYYTVSLDVSENNTPAYQVYRTTSPSVAGSHDGQSSTAARSTAGGSPWGSGSVGATGADGSELTDAQTDHAINFILAYVVSCIFFSLRCPFFCSAVH